MPSCIYLLVSAIWWNVLGIGSLLLICAYGGLVMFAYYHDCDPITTQQVSKKDQLFPLFVMQVMGDYPGIPGKSQRQATTGTHTHTIMKDTRVKKDLDIQQSTVE